MPENKELKVGKLIAIEGIDQAGKETQTKFLKENLEREGYKLKTFSFPDYTTPIGMEISEFLKGNRSYSVHVRHLLYSANRYEFIYEIESALKDGFIVIADRYSDSGISYGIANGLDENWLRALEMKLPPTDLVIFIDLPPEVAAERKKTNRDIYEQDLKFLKKCGEAFAKLLDSNQKWFRVNGNAEKEKISEEIYSIVKRFLKL